VRAVLRFLDAYSTGGAEYELLFMAKGGGSANKSYLFQETKALLTPARLLAFTVGAVQRRG